MANFMWPGAILAGAACILLIFVSIGAPTWEKVRFLKATSGSEQINFGPFGYTGSSTSFGYTFPSDLASDLDTKTIHTLTKTLFLHPLAAGFAGIAAISAIALHRVVAIFFTTLAFLTTIVAFVLSMVLFGLVRHRIRDAQGSNDAAQYSNAEWLTVGAIVALLFAWWFVLFGAFCSHKRRARGTAAY